MKLQIQLSSCTRFRHFSFNDKVTKQKNKTNPETRKNDQRHNQKKLNTSQIHYTLVQIDGCMYLVASIQFLNFDVNIYLIFTGDWNGIAYRCCDWRIRDLILAAAGRCITAQPARTRPSCPCLSISFCGDPWGPLLDYRLFC